MRDRLGITPACAGKSALEPALASLHVDHPRLRGEKIHHLFKHNYNPGSPPLARGKDNL